MDWLTAYKIPLGAWMKSLVDLLNTHASGVFDFKSHTLLHARIGVAPRVAGFGAEIAALLAEKAILDLRGPVLRVTGYDAPFPFWSLEDEHIPSPARVVDAAEKLLQF